MNAFVSLLRKEWVQYRSWLLAIVVAGLFILIGIPYLFTELLGIVVNMSNVSFILMFFVLVTGGWITIMQFISSLRADIRRKEIWLHSTKSIYILVGAKMIYTLLTFLVFTWLIAMVGLYLSHGIVDGSFLQYVFTLALMMIVAMLFQSAFIVSFNLIYVFNLQLKRFIGKFSKFITVVAVIAGFILLIKVIDNPLYGLLLQNGEVSLQFLRPYLLTYTITGGQMQLGPIYIVEEIFSWGSLIILFIISNKWLEKVVTR